MGRRSLLHTPDAELEVERSAGGGAARGAASTAAVVLHPWGRLVRAARCVLHAVGLCAASAASWSRIGLNHRQGGCMDDPIVTALYEAASRSGLFSTVVRYNQR
jgi:hypothetical protein